MMKVIQISNNNLYVQLIISLNDNLFNNLFWYILVKNFKTHNNMFSNW